MTRSSWRCATGGLFAARVRPCRAPTDSSESRSPQPGSTFFLVWTQERTDEEGISDFDAGRSFRHMVDADADILLAKVTYYLNW